MKNRKSVSWMLFLCATISPLAGCDESADQSADLQADELGQLAIMSPSLPDGAERMTVENAVALSFVPEATPVAGQYPVKNLAPTEQLVIDWLRWVNAQPWTEGAIADTTGEKCGLGQNGPIWYLAGTSGGPAVRECDIPAGKQLFFPLINRWCVFPTEFYSTDEQIAADIVGLAEFFAFQHDNLCSLTLRIDGQEVRPDMESLDEELYIEVYEPFELDLHDEHWAPDLFGGGVMPAIGEGHYALIQPLTPGDHVIELGGSICGPYAFETSVTYLLHVGP
jgi:hypothetical protein